MNKQYIRLQVACYCALASFLLTAAGLGNWVYAARSPAGVVRQEDMPVHHRLWRTMVTLRELLQNRHATDLSAMSGGEWARELSRLQGPINSSSQLRDEVSGLKLTDGLPRKTAGSGRFSGLSHRFSQLSTIFDNAKIMIDRRRLINAAEYEIASAQQVIEHEVSSGLHDLARAADTLVTRAHKQLSDGSNLDEARNIRESANSIYAAIEEHISFPYVYWDWNEHVSYDAHIDAFASIAESMAKLERVVLEHDLHHGVEVDVGDGRSRSIHGVEAISLLTDVSIRFVSDGSGEKIGEYPSLAVAKLNQSPAWRAAHSEGVVPRPSAVAHLLGGDIVEFSSYRLHRLRGFYDNWLQVLLSLRVEPRLQGERIGLAVVDPPEDASNMLQAYRSNAKEADDLLAPYRDVLRHLGAVTSFRENVENAESLITLLTDEIKGSNENPAFTYQIFEPGAVSRPMSFAGKKLKGVFAPWRIEFSAIDRQLDEENHVLTVEFDYDFESKELNDIRVLNAERLDHNTMNAIFLNREVLLELLSTVDTNFRKNRSGDAMDNARKELLLAAKSHLMSDMRGASSGVKSQTF